MEQFRPMIHVTKRGLDAFGLQIVFPALKMVEKKHPALKGLNFFLQETDPHTPSKTEQESLHAPEICFKLLCSLLLETSCTSTTLIILTIHPFKKHTISKGSRTDPLLAWLSPAEEVWFCPSNLQCSPRPQNHKGVRLLGFPRNDRK